MPKRRSEESRIVAWFQAAEPTVAQTMLAVVQGLVRTKNGPQDAGKVIRKRRAKAAPPDNQTSLLEVQADI